MARQTLTKVVPVGPYPTLQPAADSLDIAFTAADVANKEQFTPSADCLALVWNSGASPYTVTFTSVADPTTKRTGDVTTYSLAAGDHAAFRFKKTGWMQSDGNIYIEASNAAVKWCILDLG